MDELDKRVFEESDFKPKKAIIVYEQGDAKQYYLEQRDIKMSKNGYQMLSGSPLMRETLSDIMSTIDTEITKGLYSDGFLPDNLLYMSNDNIDKSAIWFVKSSKRHLSFSKWLGIKDKAIIVPNLIFHVNNGSLNLYAIKASNPTPKTILYKAPFHNIYSEDSVCMGSSVVRKSNEISEFMKAYENGFFMSKFTHLQSNGSTIKGNLNTYLESNDKIENDVLLKTTKKLEDLL